MVSVSAPSVPSQAQRFCDSECGQYQWGQDRVGKPSSPCPLKTLVHYRALCVTAKVSDRAFDFAVS